MFALKSQAISWLNWMASFLVIAAGVTPTPEPTNLTTPAASSEGTTLLIVGAFCLVLIILAGAIWNAWKQKP